MASYPSWTAAPGYGPAAPYGSGYLVSAGSFATMVPAAPASVASKSRRSRSTKHPSGRGFSSGDKPLYAEGEPSSSVRVDHTEKTVRLTRSFRKPSARSGLVRKPSRATGAMGSVPERARGKA